MSTKIAAADYEEYGVSPMAETAYQLTATITPEYATNQAVDWSVAFDNPSSAWATGKTVTDYVTVTPTSDGALTANVECLQDFGEQIIVTVTSRDNAEATASCTVDYAKRIERVTISTGAGYTMSTTSLSTGMKDSTTATTSYTVDYTYSDYTINDTFTVTATAQLGSAFLTGVKDYATENASMDTQMGAEIINGLSSESKNLISSGNNIYDITSAAGWFGLFSSTYGSAPVTAKKQALNLFVDYFKSGPLPERNVVTNLKFTFTGTYSTYTRSISHMISTAQLTYGVTGIELNEDGIIL